MDHVYHIVLRDIDGHDPLQSRHFDLSLGSTFPIGRASKNTAKAELLPALDNAYIDSPVISREHAVLSAHNDSGIPQIYITDSGSMHGTTLNGRKLSPNTPMLLKTGDSLQFGIDVNRNEEHFVARNYKFESTISRAYCRGFTVPDAESEDEHILTPERRGSQQNPLMIDDSDANSEQSVDEQLEAILPTKAEPIQDEQAAVVPEAIVHDEHPTVLMPFPITEAAELNEDCGAMDYNSVSEASGDEGGSAKSYATDSDESDVNDQGDAMADSSDSEAYAGLSDGCDHGSEAGSVDSFDPDCTSEREIPDSEDEAPFIRSVSASAKSVKPTMYLGCEAIPASSSSHIPFPPWEPAQPSGMFGEFRCSSAHNTPWADIYTQQSGRNVFTDSTTPPSPLPRLSVPNLAPWENEMHTSNQPDIFHTWYPDATPVTQNGLGSYYGGRQALYNAAPTTLDTMLVNDRPTSFGTSEIPNQPPSDHHHPPPALTSPSETQTAMLVQPNRRTKVSIEEIVDEVVDSPMNKRPLTPNSMTCLKRKADALDNEPSFMPIDTVVAPEIRSLAVLTPADTLTVNATTAIAQRPRRQPRSVIGKALRGAKYPLLGAAGAVVSFTLLSTLPDAFFGA